MTAEISCNEDGRAAYFETWRGGKARESSYGKDSALTVLDRFRLDGRRAFVTGASRGLGREMALALAEAGADVAMAARTLADLETTADDIRARGRAAWTFEADMGSPEACEATCGQALAEAGPFDILINNVGGRRVNIATEDLPLETWRELVDLNLTSTFVCSRIVGGSMIEAGRGGRIVNIASINALVAGAASPGGTTRRPRPPCFSSPARSRSTGRRTASPRTRSVRACSRRHRTGLGRKNRPR